MIGYGLLRCKTNVSLTPEVYNTRHEYGETCIRPAEFSSPERLLAAHTGGTVHSHLLVGCRPYLPTYNTQTEHTPFKA